MSDIICWVVDQFAIINAAAVNISCGSTRPFFPRESETLPMGSLCFACNLYSHSETAHGKSLWIHQKEQKNYP